MPILFEMPPQPAHIELVQMESMTGMEAKFTARALASGWSQSQADWIGRLGARELGSVASPSEAQMDAAYKAGERQLSAGYFNDAVAHGKSRLVAFLTVIDLEKQVIERGGGKAPDYGDDALKTAYAALEDAAARGLSVEDQIAAAFATLRRLAADAK